MVNAEISNIESIINILKTTETAVSGEALAETIGVSRVAVWKMINKLKDGGYNIESGRSGYKLTALTDKPLAWELERSGESIRYFNELDSTMKKADLLIKNGCSDGTTVIAGRQTAGINRSGGNWKSPEGGLYFTRIRTAPLPLPLAGLYATAVADAIADALKKAFNIEAEVRWPHEVTCNGRKLCGILTRYNGELSMILSSSTGIGVNVNIAPDELPSDAVSIMQLTGEKVSIKELLSGLLEALEEIDILFDDPDNLNSIVNKCRKNIENLSRKMIIFPGGTEKRGIASDLGPTGALIVKTDENKLISIYSGEDYSYV